MTPLQKKLLTEIGLRTVRRDDLPVGHGTTQALNALVKQGRLEKVDDTYRRLV